MKALAIYAFVPYSTQWVCMWDVDRQITPYEQSAIDRILDAYIIYITNRGYHLIDFTPVSKTVRSEALIKIRDITPSDHNGKALRVLPHKDFKLLTARCFSGSDVWHELLTFYEKMFKTQLFKTHVHRQHLGIPRFAVYHPKASFDVRDEQQ